MLDTCPLCHAQVLILPDRICPRCARHIDIPSPPQPTTPRTTRSGPSRRVPNARRLVRRKSKRVALSHRRIWLGTVAPIVGAVLLAWPSIYMLRESLKSFTRTPKAPPPEIRQVAERITGRSVEEIYREGQEGAAFFLVVSSVSLLLCGGAVLYAVCRIFTPPRKDGSRDPSRIR